MISVLLATHNDERYIKSSLSSVLNQSLVNLEVLVGFNGTVDNSKAVVQEFNDERVRIFDFGTESGKSKTLNRLLEYSKGNWIAIQDGDDIWLPDKLAKQSRYFENTDVIGTFIHYIDEYGNIIGKPALHSSHEEIVLRCREGDNQVANSTAIFRRSIALQAGGWDAEKEGVEDYDFWLRLIDMKCKFFNLPEYCVLHRLHNCSNFNSRQLRLNPITRKMFVENAD